MSRNPSHGGVEPGGSMENRLLRARARGEVSADVAFEELYRGYSSLVSAWLAVRVERRAVDDLAQDVWLIFYQRWRRWQHGPELESNEARPVLSFLFRTCRFVARGHKRGAAGRLESAESFETAELPDSSETPEALTRRLDAGRCLSLAGRICSEEELDVLLAKMAGMSNREIAGTLAITEAVVDHRYRKALARLRKEVGTP